MKRIIIAALAMSLLAPALVAAQGGKPAAPVKGRKLLSTGHADPASDEDTEWGWRIVVVAVDQYETNFLIEKGSLCEARCAACPPGHCKKGHMDPRDGGAGDQHYLELTAEAAIEAFESQMTEDSFSLAASTSGTKKGKSKDSESESSLFAAAFGDAKEKMSREVKAKAGLEGTLVVGVKGTHAAQCEALDMYGYLCATVSWTVRKKQRYIFFTYSSFAEVTIDSVSISTNSGYGVLPCSCQTRGEGPQVKQTTTKGEEKKAPPPDGEPAKTTKAPPSPTPPAAHKFDINAPPALCSAAILVTPDRERPFAVPTRLIAPDGEPLDVTEVLVITDEGEKTVERAPDGKKFLGILPPKTAKVVMIAGGGVAAAVSILGTGGSGGGGTPSPAPPISTPPPSAPTGIGATTPPVRSPFVDVTGQPATPSPVVKMEPPTASPTSAPTDVGGTTPTGSPVPPEGGSASSGTPFRNEAPTETYVRASDTPQAVVADGKYVPENSDQYRAQIDYSSTQTTTTPQTLLTTDDQMVLVNDGTKNLTGEADVTITGPEGAQTGSITSYSGKIVVTKETVRTLEALVARIEVYGLAPDQLVTYQILLPEDGHFMGPNATGNTASGQGTVAEVMALAFPLRFDSAGPKLIPVFLEPVATTPISPPAGEPTGR